MVPQACVFYRQESLGKIFLEFDGVFQEAEIFLNGKFIGRHCGEYTGFSVDITDAAQKGDNVLAIRVNNLWKPTVAPRGGEHVFSGGIYRNVRLVLESSTYIGWYGTFVTTSGLDTSNGNMELWIFQRRFVIRNLKPAIPVWFPIFCHLKAGLSHLHKR